MAAHRRLVVIVPPAQAGARLDRFLGTVAEVGTRSQGRQLIDAGRVRVDGVPRKQSFEVPAGAEVVVALVAPQPLDAVPEALPLHVLYEDDALLAIDKAAGMVVHPAPGARRGTVVNALVHRLGELTGVGGVERPGIVHRLDRDTSGVLLVARTVQALEGLARQFRERTVEKRYLAVVHGLLRPDIGVFDQPIGRHPRERKRMSVRSRRGRVAVTRWAVVERFTAATLVRLTPETGRTHQIRVHLAAAGYPIVGDRVYGVRRSPRRPGAAAGFPRQALHAEQITFAHPLDGRRVTVRAPLPADVEGLIATLRAAGTARKSSGLLDTSEPIA